MAKKITSLFGKVGIVFLLVFFVAYHLRSENSVEEPLEVVLQKENLSIIMYLYPYDVTTRIPLTDERIRSEYRTKIYIKSNSINRVKNLLLLANQENSDNTPPIDLRLLIDVLVKDETVYTIPVPEGLEKEVLETFYDLLGIHPRW